MLEVTLIDYTQDAVDKLIYTKSTRLTQGKSARRAIASMTPEQKDAELQYIAKTVPSSWEFVNYTFEIKGVTRGFTHQFVRTRTGSYAQQTMRMLNMEKFDYVMPTGVGNIDPFDDAQKAMGIYTNAMEDIQIAYDKLIELGVAPEDARGILPTNICTNIIAQFNLRTLSEMVRSRSSSRVQDEYRKVTYEMANAVTRVHPWVIQFLYPDEQRIMMELDNQIGNLKKMDDSKMRSNEAVMAVKNLDQLRKLVS